PQFVRHIGEEPRLGAIGLIRRIARDLQLLNQIGQLGFVLFQFGYVCIGCDDTTVGSLALADSDPTTVTAALEVGFVGGVVTCESFLDPGVAASLGILDQAASGSCT